MRNGAGIIVVPLLAAAASGLGLPAARANAAQASDATIRAVRSEAPIVDGRLDDASWDRAEPATGFVQRDPVEGAPATFQTEVRVLFTDEAMYVGLRAFDPVPGEIMAPLAPRDSRPFGDWVGILLDSSYDRRSAFEFAVNPAGVRWDAYRFDDFGIDAGWDGVWEAAVDRDHAGWSAELRIPLSQLRYLPSQDLRFGFNAYREVGRTREIQFWRLLSKEDRRVVSRSGDLVGLGGLPPPPTWELSPYATTRRGYSAEAGARLQGGLDLRLAPARGWTVDAAVNPDFGQIEADPAVVNLTTLETFYPERRPLFVEDSDLFRLPLGPEISATDAILYTRRIGRVPQLDVSGTSEPTTILGAAKIVRRTSTGWSLGALTAVTARETDPGDAERDAEELVEPATSYGAVRLSRDLAQGRSQVATFGTVVVREGAAESHDLRSHAVVAGVAASLRPRNGPYLARGLFAFSSVGGSARAIAATQRSPVHYFQRPDQRFARFDSLRTSLTGSAAWFELARDRGAFTGSARLTSLSPELEVNDLGFLSQAGQHSARLIATRRWLERPRFREMAVHGEAFWDADWAGHAISTGAGVRASTTLDSYWQFSAEAWRALGGAEVEILQGGPALRRKGNGFYKIDVQSDSRRAFRGALSLVARPFDEHVASERRVIASVIWRPATNVEAELLPSYEKKYTRHQFVGAADLDGSQRYVLGHLDQESLRLGLRLNVTFTPSLSLQGFAEVLSSLGEYREFYEVLEPDAATRAERLATIPEGNVSRTGSQVAFDLDGDGDADLTTAPADGSLLSLRSTMVLRWDFRLGSSLSFVVQEDGLDTDGLEYSRPFDGLGQISSLSHRTVAMLKLTYWFSL
jgi:hypothetical protein